MYLICIVYVFYMSKGLFLRELHRMSIKWLINLDQM